VVGAQFPSKNRQKRGHNFLTNENKSKVLSAALCIGQTLTETTSVSN
jgi:hypothetical protein